jgi:hypothetical protein
MRTFHCDVCGNPVFFENTYCTHCNHVLGVIPDVLRVCTLQTNRDGTWRALARLAAGRAYRKCDNYAEHDVCNWMVPADSTKRFCIACELNAVIPNLSRPGFTERWYRLERSKRRLVYTLLKLGLPLRGYDGDPAPGLAFSFLSNLDAADGETVMTGHADGHITINIDEADPAKRERSRVDLNETYRTLLGHFRHEVGHYYWDRLIRDGGALASFRELFGDERRNYAEALDHYYQAGAPPDWQAHYISRYASAHPWEDWAESWAHYLHIIDTLETAVHYGVRVERRMPNGQVHRADPRFDPYRVARFEELTRHWIPLTGALNSLNRSMGLPDIYPFVLSDTALRKLKFIHKNVRSQRRFDIGYDDGRDVDRYGLVQTLLRQLTGVLLDRAKGIPF